MRVITLGVPWSSHETNCANRILVMMCNLKILIRGPFEKFVDWRQCAAVMQREAVTVMPSCSGGGNAEVA
jgi:hypothetical protein